MKEINKGLVNAMYEFENKYGDSQKFNGFLPDHLTKKEYKIKRKDGTYNEDFYKWKFLYGLVQSGMFPKENIGLEIQMPKGNVNSSVLKIDAVVFDDNSWFEHYKKYIDEDDMQELDWIRNHMLSEIEFKDEGSFETNKIWEKQLKPAMQESDRSKTFGILYDRDIPYLFKKTDNGDYLRQNDFLNTNNGSSSKKNDLNLQTNDSYSEILSFEELLKYSRSFSSLPTYDSLTPVSGINSGQINHALSNILKTMDSQGLTNQNGYNILIQMIAAKIFDERQCVTDKKQDVRFYITDGEYSFKSVTDENVQKFKKRIQELFNDAGDEYIEIIDNKSISFKSNSEIKVIAEIVKQFQNISFQKSTKSNLYQLVFNQFASEFSKANNSQFITPLPVIDFVVNIVNPKRSETVLDPTVGIADFLSKAYIHANGTLKDKDMFGVDIDSDMVRLAQLNMLLNGDGNSSILTANSEYGSLSEKISKNGKNLIDLDYSKDSTDWDNRNDDKYMKKLENG